MLYFCEECRLNFKDKPRDKLCSDCRMSYYDRQKLCAQCPSCIDIYDDPNHVCDHEQPKPIPKPKKTRGKYKHSKDFVSLESKQKKAKADKLKELDDRNMNLKTLTIPTGFG